MCFSWMKDCNVLPAVDEPADRGRAAGGAPRDAGRAAGVPAAAGGTAPGPVAGPLPVPHLPAGHPGGGAARGIRGRPGEG